MNQPRAGKGVDVVLSLVQLCTNSMTSHWTPQYMSATKGEMRLLCLSSKALGEVDKIPNREF